MIIHTCNPAAVAHWTALHLQVEPTLILDKVIESINAAHINILRYAAHSSWWLLCLPNYCHVHLKLLHAGFLVCSQYSLSKFRQSKGFSLETAVAGQLRMS